MKFFTDIKKGDDRTSIQFYPEKLCSAFDKIPSAVRLWIEVAIPADKELWPKDYEGIEVKASVIKDPK